MTHSRRVTRCAVHINATRQRFVKRAPFPETVCLGLQGRQLQVASAMDAVKEARAAVKEALTELNAMAKDVGLIDKTCSLRCAAPPSSCLALWRPLTVWVWLCWCW